MIAPMEKEKKTLSLKPKQPTVDAEGTIKRPTKRRVVRREDIPAEKLANARPAVKRGGFPMKKPIKKLTPAEQQAVDLTTQLAEVFPMWAQHKPLALGIEAALQEYFDRAQIPVSKRVLHRVLWHHTHQKEYLQQVLIETQRYELNGKGTGEIKPAEKEHAQRTLDEIALVTAPKPARPRSRHPSPPRSER
ncbi:MAG: ProQ/FINO family [Pseudomonadota bacterium]